jgi:uncharacterized membrane protein
MSNVSQLHEGRRDMNGAKQLSRWIALGAGVMTIGAFAKAHAQTAPQSLVYAVYDNETGAKDAYNAMKQTQREGVIHIDSFALVSKDQKARVHVQSTQKRGARAGAVVGALVGALGGPAGAAAGAAAGGGIGYLTGESVGIPREDIDAIKAALTPGSSALVAVIDERWVADLERSMHEAQAKQVLDHKLAATAATTPETGSNPPATTPPSNQPQPNP